MSKRKQIIVPAVILFVICFIVTLLLAVTNRFTVQPIADINAKRAQEARAEVLGSTVYKELKESDGCYIACDDLGAPVAYVFTETDKGYGGTMTVMVGIDDNGIVTGVKISQHSETVGMGAKAAKPDFLGQYITAEPVDEFAVGTNIDGVTGATISSKAVTRAVNKALEAYKAITEGGAK